MVALFFAFPRELVLGIAGIALLSSIGSCLHVALEDEVQREPAMVTILISASGFSLWGIGAAFWGVLLGIMASLLLNWNRTAIADARTAA